jgi:hypothetical protein
MINRCLNVILKNGAWFFEFISFLIFNAFTPNPPAFSGMNSGGVLKIN